MAWADLHIKKLSNGETVRFKPRGNSMKGLIESGQLVEVKPLENSDLKIDDIVLCKVKGKQYLHKISALQGNRIQISNNRGFVNGWITRNGIYGILTQTF